MGDLMSLVERAQVKIKQEEQERLEKSFAQGKFTLEDFAQQIDMMNKMGPLSSLVKYLPGTGSLNVSQDKINQGEVELKRFRSIINSMTKKERTNTKLLDHSRKRRIAVGAGVTIKDIENLLSKFEQSQQFVKMFNRMGGFKGLFK